jgi:DNA processing protein
VSAAEPVTPVAPTAPAGPPASTGGPAAERLARALLSLVAEPGDPAFTGLVEQLGGVGAVEALRHDGDRHQLLEAATARLATVDPARELARAADRGIRFVVPGDAEWPTQLDDLSAAGALQERGGPPIGLWVRGPGRLDALEGSVAVVGSRSATVYGDQVAGDIAAELGHARVPVVSGAAFGIDYAAHRGALSGGGATVAVLACGVDRVYPAAHRPMIDHLAREHVVVSEAPIDAAPHRVRFLSRNRLIAALSRGTVVVEAAARSGALNTANWAQRMHRLVMGVPGPVGSATSVGVHQQIRSGAATLVTSGRDVLELVGHAGEHLVAEPRGPEQARDQLSVKQRQVLDGVPVGAPSPTASIAVVIGLGIVEVERTLHRLAERGLVVRAGDGWRLGQAALD